MMAPDFILDLIEKSIYDDNVSAEKKLVKMAKEHYQAFVDIITSPRVNTEIRANAARILSETLEKEKLKDLIDLINQEEYPIIRMGLLYGLIEREAFEFINFFVNDPDRRIRSKAIEAISVYA
ncbi:hypothetical protein KQY10_13550 [Leptospira interrogans]|nr:hypothetical protein [Leptospira interrogans]ALN99221.1 hypothetical protein LIH_02475 [Leptospira interrogans serovar Hardjo-prajitno]MCD1166607.1 hypothetical protein [Leptospira interrogans]MCH1885172.1 hypothetical protein [Leptospira interrogans]MCH1891418.1 hypothetical protein [Leptospira interrogans]MCH1898212.1 hypothetical protein [Leptospira interrogans]